MLKGLHVTPVTLLVQVTELAPAAVIQQYTPVWVLGGFLGLLCLTDTKPIQYLLLYIFVSAEVYSEGINVASTHKKTMPI